MMMLLKLEWIDGIFFSFLKTNTQQTDRARAQVINQIETQLMPS
jgi:hypothetical protein